MIKLAVAEIDRGLVDADLGGGLIKKRIAMPGQGKRGSFRTLLAYQAANKAIFVYGFSKNQQDNIDPSEKKILKKLAKNLLGLSDKLLETYVNNGILFEVK